MKQATTAPLLELAIDALDSEGRGVARSAAGKVAFVEGALPGERVAAELLRQRRSFDELRTVTILQPGSGRRAPRCPHFGVCGGCLTQHADARTQMAAKQRWLEDSLERIGRVRPDELLPIVYGEEWSYRQRARLAVRRVARKGGVLVGFHERRSSYVADMTRCEILPERISRLIPALRALIESLSVRERLPQVELAAGEGADVLVFRHLVPLTPEDEAKLRAFARQAGVQAWLQPRGPTSAHPLEPLDGAALDYSLPEFGLRLGFAPTDFTQVNQAMNRLLVSRAVRLLDPAPGERIADLYCGLGNFSLPLARRGARVLGLEASEVLVERARRNAAANGLEAQATFAREDLSRIDAARLAALGPFEKLLVDPPRQGAIEVVRSLAADWPRRIVYVSCDPATLARDAGVLVHTRGFRLAAAGVANMFPHTGHVESVALFERG